MKPPKGKELMPVKHRLIRKFSFSLWECVHEFSVQIDNLGELAPLLNAGSARLIADAAEKAVVRVLVAQLATDLTDIPKPTA